MPKLSRVAVCTALALSGAAVYAQSSSVTLFGIVDTNVSHLRSGGNGSANLLGTDGNLSSRLGFRGVEDLGGGLKAGFWLEAAINPDVGTGGSTSANNQPSGASNSGGLTFGRRSTVSLMGDKWGEVRIGRDYVPGFWNLSNFSPFGTNGIGSSSFLFYPVQSPSRITNVRASNSIGYHLPKMGGLYGQAMYAFGENSASGPTKNDGRVMGARLGYKSGPVNVAVGITKTEISSLGDLRQTNIGGSYDFGVAELMLLWNENKVGDTSTKSALVGARIPAGPGHFRVAYSQVKAKGVANDAAHLALGYVYELSKRTALYGHVARIDNKGNGMNYNLGLAVKSPGGNSDGFEFGVRHSF
ncbi:porin [Diaphorobacter sp. HDW4A]|uniref:porin n=1 Tax=Diaphorobacter sp. HDW4A TaxID=2714924 RepID=UPI00140E5307|nr:porin [Diaphorobacter sp. HDW4A]QIL80460.1 porin [Diaphorobacter sp. HDW4A]